MRTLPKTAGSLAALALALSVGSAQAALVNFSVTGDVVFGNTGNNFGLLSGSTITATGTFDDEVLNMAGDGLVSFASGSGNSLELVVGNYTFTAADDLLFASTRPTLSLTGFGFDFLDFETDDLVSRWFASDQFRNFIGGDYAGGSISGTWINASFEMTAVPVPAAVWLFGSGLMGLVGVARRKSAA